MAPLQNGVKNYVTFLKREIASIRGRGALLSSHVLLFQNLQGLQGYTRPKRDVFAFHPEENDSEIEKLYQGMIMLSRSYAMQN